MDKKYLSVLIKKSLVIDRNGKEYEFAHISAEHDDAAVVYDVANDKYMEIKASEIDTCDCINFLGKDNENKTIKNLSVLKIGNDCRRIIKLDERNFRFEDNRLPLNTVGYFNALDKLNINYEIVSTDKEKSKRRLFVDIDGTLAEFKVLDTLEKLYEKGYFRNLKPLENVVNAINNIVENTEDIEVYILSAVVDSPYCKKEKIEWVNQYLPQIKNENMIFTKCGTPKTDYIENLTEDDCLLDDYTINLLDFEPPAHGIKILNGINHTHKTWQGDIVNGSEKSNILAEEIMRIVRDKNARYEKSVDKTIKGDELPCRENTQKI